MTTSFESLRVGDGIDGPSFGATRHDDDAPITRMITSWAGPLGAVHRRLETRWVRPVRPGDTVHPTGLIKAKRATKRSRYVLIDVVVRSRSGKTVATGEAMVEFPRDLICP
jgi:acyl dehydratase